MLWPASRIFNPPVGVFDGAVGVHFDDLGSGLVDGERPAGGDAEGCTGFAERLALPSFGRHGKWVRG